MLLATLLGVQFSCHLVTILGFDRVCKDPFDVKITMMQWIEWQVTVPLIIYILITFDLQKQSIDIYDVTMLILSALTIFLPFMNNFGVTFKFATFNIFLSSISIVISLSLLLRQSNQSYEKCKPAAKLVSNISYIELFTMNVTIRKVLIYLLVIYQ